MQFTSAEIAAWVGGFLWPLSRVTGMMLSAPVLSSRVIPKRVRLMLTLALTWSVLPLLPAMPVVEPLGPDGLLVTAQQLLIGVSMGFILRIVFSALELGGQVIAMQVGLSFASLADPQSGGQSPLLSQLYNLLGTLIFLALNGHLLLMQMLMDSFHALPVAPSGADRDWLWVVVVWGSRMFSGAVLVALPAIVSLLVVNLAFGVMVRAAPQLNIFAVGIPITLVLGLMIILYSLPTLLYQMEQLLSESFARIGQLAGGGG